MARSRNIKPGFFTNDVLGECDPLARLLFAGLWTVCDREGRTEDRPKRIRAELLPYDNCDADELLSQLAKAGFLIRYEISGSKYLQVVNFNKHQDPHYKEKASEIPVAPGHENSAKTPGGVSESVRQAVFDRDGRSCKACSSSDDLSLDHIVPRSKGGSHEESNLQTLCRRCNSAKNNREAGSIISQSSANDKPNSVYQPGGELPLIPSPLIPDSLLLIPDSLLLIPDSLKKKESAYAPPLPPELLKDFLEVRKAKKVGKLTATALAGIEREGVKCGLDLIQTVTACCEFGWASFNAKWYAERTASKPAATTTRQTESFAASDARAKREAWEAMTNRKWPEQDLPGNARGLVIDAEPNNLRRIA